MKKLTNPFLSVVSVALIIGSIFSACTPDNPTNDPIGVSDISLTTPSDLSIEQGASDANTTTVSYVNQSGGLAGVVYELSGLPAGVTAESATYEAGSGGVGAETEPVAPCDIVFTYFVDAQTVAGLYEITLSVVPFDANDGSQSPELGNEVEATFTLTVTDPGSGSTDCNTDLEGNYAGPGTCAPPGWGDTHVDFAITTDPNTLEVYIEFFDQGSTVTATLDCNNNSFTIPQQICTAGNGAQQVNVDGSGTWVIGQTSTTIDFTYNTQVVGSTDPPTACQVDLTKQ